MYCKPSITRPLGSWGRLRVTSVSRSAQNNHDRHRTCHPEGEEPHTAQTPEFLAHLREAKQVLAKAAGAPFFCLGTQGAACPKRSSASALLRSAFMPSRRLAAQSLTRLANASGPSSPPQPSRSPADGRSNLMGRDRGNGSSSPSGLLSLPTSLLAIQRHSQDTVLR
jgi:hypothetical protein